jgi:hypothetical protein
VANQQNQSDRQDQQHSADAMASLAGGAVPMEDFYMPPSNDEHRKPATR